MDTKLTSEGDCKLLKALGYVSNCCGTCHSYFMPNRGFHEVAYRGAFLVKVCCSMKRAIKSETKTDPLKWIGAS